MGERAGGKQVIEVSGGAHALPVSRPEEVAQTILEALSATGLVDA